MSTSISLGAGFPASGEILDPLSCVAACFFSNALDILPLSKFAIPIGRSCGHLTKSSELTRSDLRQGRIMARLGHGGWATAELPTLSRDSPVLCCPNYEDLHAGIGARYICIEQRLLIPV